MSSNKSIKVFQLLMKKGFPDEFCKEIAYKYMNTDYTADRMERYLIGYKTPSLEEVVDEMYAIISDRDRIVAKHQLEQAQTRINQMYREGLE